MSKAPLGNISKRSGGWMYRFAYRDTNGQRRYISRQGFETRDEAVRTMRAAMTALDAGRGMNPLRVTAADYLRMWVDEYARSGKRKDSTALTTRNHVEAYLVPWLTRNDRPVLLGKLTADTIARMYADLLATGRRGRTGEAGAPLSPKTVRNIAGTLHRALHDAVRRGHLPSNPADLVELPTWRRRDLTVWQAAEVAHFLRVALDHDDPMYAIWRLVVATGMRRGELLGLRWSDVSLADGAITICQTRVRLDRMVTTTPKTKSGRRTIALDHSTITALAHLRNQQDAAAEALAVDPYELVATDLDGRLIHACTVLDRFRAATERADLPRCRLHDLRHSAAAYWLEQQVPVHIVAGRLGHRSPTTTLAIYAAFLPAADREASTNMAAGIDRLMAADAHTMRTMRTDAHRKTATSDDARLAKPLRGNDATTRDDDAMVGRPGLETNTNSLRRKRGNGSRK